LFSHDSHLTLLDWQADQRLCEWRSAFGSAAVTILLAFFEDSDDLTTDEERRQYAEDGLFRYAFMYNDIKESRDGSVSFHLSLSKPVRSNHILATA
jgi:hypothetical protein